MQTEIQKDPLKTSLVSIAKKGRSRTTVFVQANSWRALLLAGSLSFAVACTPQETIERPDLLPKMTAPQFCFLDTAGGIKRLVVTITSGSTHSR